MTLPPMGMATSLTSFFTLVHGIVFFRFKKLQILNSVIEAITILVMDVVTIGYRMSKVLFHDHTMLEAPFTVMPNIAASIGFIDVRCF